MGNFGAAEMLVIGVFALLVFGPQKLPEMARSVGRAIREFKKATGEFTQELKVNLDETPKSTKSAKTPAEQPKELRPGPR
ncbi:MAG TPA: twin-arginine translocase TatA/TatE family subunit [Actinomycetota bacterium]|nr:twin-arginine translocase TatA/TatE family subunit [Actinomycetota bacterium]